MKLLTPEEATKVLLPKLSSVRGRLTLADAAAATGLAIEDARTALEALMNQYVCRLQVTESGEILYDFGSSLRRRGAKSFREITADLWAVTWKAITVLFKIWITVTIVVYFSVFVIILIAIIAALSSKDSDGGFDFIGDIFGDLFTGIGRGLILVDTVDRQGYQHKSYRQSKRKDPGKVEIKKRFVQSVYDFVLGPARPAFDPFANEKEVLAWLRENKGVLTTTEVVALAGWTYEEAEERMADYLTRFKGEAEITEDGVLIGNFRQVLSKGDASMEGGKVELFWDEFEAPYEITGNTGGRNFFIAFMNGFNLFWALIFTMLEATDTEIYDVLPDWISLGFANVVLGWIPLTYSLLVFLVPLARSLVVSRLEMARIQRNKKRRIIRAIFDLAEHDLTEQELFAAVNKGPQAPLKEQEFSVLFQRLAVEYQGTADLMETGGTVYRFDRIRRERASARLVRERTTVPETTEKIIFDTGSGTTLPEAAPGS